MEICFFALLANGHFKSVFLLTMLLLLLGWDKIEMWRARFVGSVIGIALHKFRILLKNGNL